MGIAIVTGASSGMGAEFVRQIGGRGSADGIWAIARREERLLELAKETDMPVEAIACDLTDPADIKKITDKLLREKPDVSLLVNCAGFAKFGDYAEVGLQNELNMIDLDVRALVYMTQTVLPYMGEKASIVQVASTAAFQPLPDMNVYAASKAFVLSYARALNMELQERGVSVTAVCPGWTKTEFFDVAGKDADATAVQRFPFMSTPRQVVKSALKAAEQHREMCVPGIINKGHLFFSKIIPNSLIMRIWNMLRG